MSQQKVTVTYPNGTPYTRSDAICDGCRPESQGGGNGVHIVADASAAAAEVAEATRHGLTATVTSRS